MRFIIILMYGFVIIGCSKKSEQVSQTEPVKKTLSGIFGRGDNTPRNYIRWDFRTDGTVIHEVQLVEIMRAGDSTAERIMALSGKGLYTIQNDKVTVKTLLLSKTSFNPNLSNMGINDRISGPQTNIDMFRIDGDDLIHLLIAIVGEKTNIDESQQRYIRKR